MVITPTRASLKILPSCHLAILFRLLILILLVKTPPRALLSRYFFIQLLLVKTPTRAILKNLAILPSCNPVPAVPLSEAQNHAIMPSCSWLFMLILLVKTPPRTLLSHSFFHTTLGGDNTNKGFAFSHLSNRAILPSCSWLYLFIPLWNYLLFSVIKLFYFLHSNLGGDNTNKCFSKNLAILPSCPGRFLNIFAIMLPQAKRKIVPSCHPVPAVPPILNPLPKTRTIPSIQQIMKSHSIFSLYLSSSNSKHVDP